MRSLEAMIEVAALRLEDHYFMWNPSLNLAIMRAS